MSVGRKYKAMWKLLAATQYESPFEITKDVKKFVTQYGLSKDFNKKKVDGEEEGKLLDPVAQELLRTSSLFIHNEHKEKRIHIVSEGVKVEVQGLIRSKYLDQIKIMPEVEVEIVREDSKGGDQHWNVYLVMKLGNAEVETDLESLRYSSDPAENIDDAAESYDWAAWLGIPESPFFDDVFVDEYAEDQASIAIEQFWHTRSETNYFREVNSAIKELIEDYKPNYKFVVDLNERGSFRAHVEDPEGKPMFDISNESKNEDGTTEEGDLWLIEDGFMKNIDDMKGLLKYLKEQELVPEHATLGKGQ